MFNYFTEKNMFNSNELSLLPKKNSFLKNYKKVYPENVFQFIFLNFIGLYKRSLIGFNKITKYGRC